MRNWGWIKLVVLDVLSSPLFGSISFCRTEVLGVEGGGGGKTVFPVFCPCQEKLLRVSPLCAAHGRLQGARTESIALGVKHCSGGQWTQVQLCCRLPRSHPGGTYHLLFVLRACAGAQLMHISSLRPGIRCGSGPQATGDFFKLMGYLWEFYIF